MINLNDASPSNKKAPLTKQAADSYFEEKCKYLSKTIHTDVVLQKKIKVIQSTLRCIDAFCNLI